ncbi:MAG: phosphodiester glycosidase family protein [Bacteroidales bacterium]|nr:phosphodiester glycosidase family protein [Bacteroidales bacterium]
MKLDDLLAFLGGEKIETWFDLGLFIDRFKENQNYPSIMVNGSYDDFKEQLRKGGIGFLTFHYMVDGVTIEVNKYASLIRRNIPGIPVHYISGEIHVKTAPIIQEEYKKCIIPELTGFNDWELYKDFYFTNLERGNGAYNSLIKKLWAQTLVIIEKLGRYIENERINLLYVINVCSNPGNVSLALATVLLSEFLGIPVINNNHDFYWEGGMCKSDREKSTSKSGPRDLFFTNYHLGEVFSIIEVLFPWQSRSWINVNINRGQSDHMIRTNGHNPSNVMEIGTAVDTSQYTKNDKRKNINTFIQVEKILSRYTDQMVSFSVEDVLSGGLVAENNPRPILIGARTGSVDRFIGENIIFLQPTRIISRKRIETSFSLLIKMFEHEEMVLRFRRTSHLKMTLLITGPIAVGHYGYYRKLIERFQEFLDQVGSTLKNRIYLALLFGELDRESFKERFDNPAGISELYNISSLVLLPSKMEGRGLPIIEATACGTPIFCRRYEPEEVYSEVIGEHLGEKDRLKVLEFRGKKISNTIVKKIIDRVFFPHRYTDEFRHNKKVVHERYSLDSLNENIHKILHRLYTQLNSNEKVLRIVRECIDDYREMVNFTNEDLRFLLDTRNRHYLPGYGRLSFMLMLKSLIDPSYFRVEQQHIRGMAFHFARAIISNDPDADYIPREKVNSFYNAIETLFITRKGETEIQHDHSMSYRHRHMAHYPYQDYTFQELTGLINLLYIRIVQPTPLNKVDLSPQFFTDWNLALLQLTGSSYLAIDDRKKLIEVLQTNLPIAYFPGAYIMYELEFFALQSIRSRLGLPIEEAISRKLLIRKAKQLQAVYIFAQERNLGKQLNKDEITDYIVNGKSEELKLLYEFKVIQIIRTKQVCVGIHFPQLGSRALKVLRSIQQQNGYLLTNRSNAAMMTDMVNMDRFHIGKVTSQFHSSIMGIPVDSGYIQFVPAGVRATLSYPTPVQTAKDFERALKSDLFKTLKQKLGEKEIMTAIREDAIHRGSPVMHVLQSLEQPDKEKKEITYEYVSGTYDDGMPYNGAIAQINFRAQQWDFAAVTTPGKPKTVLQFVKTFNRQSGKTAQIAWNGGYILNPELVGKLGLPETYIGSPLGMLISAGSMISPPLFNKPALIIDKDGSIDIRRVNCARGLFISWKNREIELSGNAYNRDDINEEVSYFDLLYRGDDIDGNGRIIVRLAGNEVKEIIETGKEERIPIVPVGLTFAFSRDAMLPELKKGDKLAISVHGYGNVLHAVEAGPLLLDQGKVAIDMETEGWKTNHSIRTQAARLDYTNMRGPKIAVGINSEGQLAVLTINGRIRESVGATHFDMAAILKKHGMERAMGFDPGGSSTLVVADQILNISPYNKNYESNVYALPPEPRAVSNAIIGFISE